MAINCKITRPTIISVILSSADKAVLINNGPCQKDAVMRIVLANVAKDGKRLSRRVPDVIADDQPRRAKAEFRLQRKEFRRTLERKDVQVVRPHRIGERPTEEAIGIGDAQCQQARPP